MVMFNELYKQYLLEYATVNTVGYDNNILTRPSIETINITPMNVPGPAVTSKIPQGLFPQGKRKRLKKRKK